MMFWSKDKKNPVIQELDDRLKQKFPDLDVSLGGTLYIRVSKIVVPKKDRRKGIGTQVMDEIIGYADSVGKIVVLTPSDDFGSSTARLRKFYKRFGFIENRGMMARYEISESMYRLPK